MKYRLLTCNACKKEFKHPYQPGRVPVNCISCRDVPRIRAMNKQATMVDFTCRSCHKDVTEPRSRGYQQVNCKECREKPKVQKPKVIKPVVETVKPIVYKAALCVECKDPFTFQLKRGKRPIRCVPCREERVNLGNKVALTAELECIICENMFPKPKKRGKPNPVCPTCLHKAGKITESERDVSLQPNYTGERLADYLIERLRVRGLLLSQQKDRKWA